MRLIFSFTVLFPHNARKRLRSHICTRKQEICAGVWFFSIWILVKKFLISIVLTTLDGRPNTWCAIVLQAVDCVLLLFTRPYNNRQTEFTEAFGSITNLLVCDH